MTRYFWLILSLLLACKAQKPGVSNSDASSSQSKVQTVTTIPGSAQPLAFELIEEGQYSGYHEAGNQLITDADSWKELWTKMGSNQIPPPPLPEVDFTTHLVIASFMGPQTSGGHSLKITAVESESSIAYVSVTHRKPGENCFVTDAITQPYAVIKVKKAQLESAAFVTKEEINEC